MSVEAAVQPIILTQGAVNQLRTILTEQNIPTQYGLRVGVKGGGCSGFSYVMGFDEPKEGDDTFEINGIKVSSPSLGFSYVMGFDEPKEGDDTFEINGIKVFMQKSHAIYLLGMEIDFVEGLNNRGFSFTNPNAKESCGCGTSFSA